VDLKHASIFSVAIATLFIASPAFAAVIDEHDGPPTVTAGPGEATVYFMRPASLGMAINFYVFVDETLVGATKGNTYTYTTVPAGEHIVWARSGNVSALKVTLEAGKTYYFEQKVKMGGLKARVSLEPMAEAEALEQIAKDPWTSLTDEGKEKGAEHLAEDHAEAVATAAAPGAAEGE
jgi:hypothetical protein